MGLPSTNENIKTRPEEQPITTVVPDTARDVGLYSGGSHKRLCSLYTIQVPLPFKPYPVNCTEEDKEDATAAVVEVVRSKSNVPIFVCK
jgi:hypothetical protein